MHDKLLIAMDNGYINRTKNHQTSKVVGFLGRSVSCPDKLIGKIFRKEKSRSLQATGAWAGGVFLLTKNSNVMVI